ncbi:hypothetical protein QQS21_012749 [Conoideocrella luteorostrata]|uniref:DUF7053 domain-containing protein n=1 Tax=Conoideocrella luteorostrata TaxID=1105319 RepID=A0AAJ0FM22_9HYPO|nr:hypothetical protein QQS21_012749 [Conoideocrella luteorostrata]
MSKRTLFTSTTPLPRGLSREAAIAFLHDHVQMIDLNPLIKERHRIPPPPHSPDEELGCIWYSLTDKVSYLPGGLASSEITYTCAFHDLSRGLQTHCYAPMGVETRSKWSIGGSMPGEPSEPVELGLGAPTSGLYLREDVDLRCNILMAGFVKKTIKKSHSTLVDRLSEVARSQAGASSSSSMPSGYQQQRQQQQQQQQQTASSQSSRSQKPPSLTLQNDRQSTSHSRHASSGNPPVHSHHPSGPNPYTDRPLPPTPPVELEDKALLAGHAQHGSRHQPQPRPQPTTAELQ